MRRIMLTAAFLVLCGCASLPSWPPGPVPTPEPTPPPPPDPSPICEVGKEDCDCYVKPPGEDWKSLACEAPRVCKNKVCTDPVVPPPPIDPPPIDPPLPPSGCYNVEPLLIGIPDIPSTTTQIVIDSMQKILWYSGSPKEMLEKLANRIVLDGHCAFAGIEAVFVRREDKLWGEHHAVYFNDGIIGKWNTSAKYMLSHREEIVEDACGLPTPPPLQDFDIKHTPGRKWPFDGTPQVHGCDFPEPGRNFCDDIGLGTMPGQPDVRRCDCPAGNEVDPAKRSACEKKITGGGLWKSDGVTEVNPGNPFLARCTACTWIKLCHADGTKCKRVELN